MYIKDWDACMIVMKGRALESFSLTNCIVDVEVNPAH